MPPSSGERGAPPLSGGRRVRVAVVDSGIYPDHPHVGGISGGIGFTSPDGPNDDYLDRLGHGTAVAAAIREKAPDVELFAVKIFDRTLATSIGSLVAAIGWAIDSGMEIINLSLGTARREHHAALSRLVERAAARGGADCRCRRRRRGRVASRVLGRGGRRPARLGLCAGRVSRRAPPGPAGLHCLGLPADDSRRAADPQPARRQLRGGEHLGVLVAPCAGRPDMELRGGCVGACLGPIARLNRRRRQGGSRLGPVSCIEDVSPPPLAVIRRPKCHVRRPQFLQD